MGALKGCLMIVGALAILGVGSCTLLGYGTYKAVETAVEDGTFDEMMEQAERDRIRRENAAAAANMADFGIEEYSADGYSGEASDWGAETQK